MFRIMHLHYRNLSRGHQNHPETGNFLVLPAEIGGPLPKEKRGRREEGGLGGWGADIIKNIVISFQISLLILKTMTMHLLIPSPWQLFSYWPRIARQPLALGNRAVLPGIIL